MIISKSKFFALAGMLICLAFVSGCSTVSNFFSGSTGDGAEQAFDTPAQVLATEAEQLYQDGEYEEAAESFQQLKDRYPYSKFALLADLRVGDAYFKSDRFDEAVLSYEDFIRLHPKNEGVPYAMYQIGMVYHAQMLTPDRDPTFAEKSMKAFQKLVRDYPNNEWSIKAMPRLQESAARAAEHDLEVAQFYYSIDKYKAAIHRFDKVLTKYPDVGLYDEAMTGMRNAQNDLAEEEAEKAEEAAKEAAEVAAGQTDEETIEEEKVKKQAEKDQKLEEHAEQPFPATEVSRDEPY